MTLNPDFKIFLVKASIATLLLGGLVLFFFSTLLKSYYHPAIPYTIAFFFITNSLVFYFQSAILHTNKKKFTLVFLITLGAKLFAYLIFLLLMFLLVSKTNIFALVITVLLLYIIYSILEIREVLLILKRTSKNGDKSE